MGYLLVGLILFFGVHAVSIINESWRARMVAKIGEGPWKGLYALISLIGLVLLVSGYGLARQDSASVYVGLFGMKHLAMLLMLPVFPLLLATYFPGRIREGVRHPMLLATLLWSLAHLLVNGRLADLLLFGGFFLWAALDLLSMRQRTQRALPAAPRARFNDLIVLLLGLAIYGVFLVWGHRYLIGVPLIATRL